MYHFSQVSNGEHSSVANVGGLETDSFNFQQHVFDAQFSCLKFDSQNLLCQSSGDNSAPILFGSVVDSFLSSDEDTFCDTYSEYSELPCHEVSLYEHFRHENNILESNYSAPVNEVEVVCATSGMVPTRKNRIKWTKDLHEQFVVAVNSLGGPQKGYKESQGRDMVTELQQKIYMQLEESRLLQLEIERGIQEQLKAQRNLQMLVEEQKEQVNSVTGQNQTKQTGGS
ncbi:Myb family transcription factor PHL5 [Glycine soja]